MDGGTTDILNRRLRTAKPQPRASVFKFSDRDYALFHELYEHGPLPSNYLFELTKPYGINRRNFLKRLTEFYNGTTKGEQFLVRPPQQWASYYANYQPLVYDVAPRVEVVLAESGNPRIMRTDPFLHRFMGACVSASIKLACRANGYRFISFAEIIKHKRCPEKTRLSENPLALPVGNAFLVPDNLFGIEYPNNGGFRFFTVENDRNTESIERRNLSQNAFGRKLDLYLTAMHDRAYIEHWGLPSLMMMTVTTNATHLHNMLDFLKKANAPKFADHFIFKACPTFGANWRVPTTVMADLFNEPWQRAVGGEFDLRKA